MIKCPSCGSTRYYFEGTFIKCESCGRMDRHLTTMSEVDWNAILKKWGIK